jgi:Uma2 family endonuclease
MAAPKLDRKQSYTYADYLTWPTEERWELIDGVPYNMSPAPSRGHQGVAFRLSGIIYHFLLDKPCSAYTAPFDVRLPSEEITPRAGAEITDEKTLTVVQPDLLVVCDRSRLDDRGLIGAPDIAVEILSESTAYRDETEKLKLYEKHGVKEYWIINPEARYMWVYRLDGEKYARPDYFREDDIFESGVLAGLRIELGRIWERE